MKENVVEVKSFVFAVQIVKLCKILRIETKEYSLVDQLLRAGTSIGANVSEGVRAASKADFYAKMNIALKEASETEYWLRLFLESGIVTKMQFSDVYPKCEEILKILVAIVKTKKPDTKQI